jgi:hypothetical protein
LITFGIVAAHALPISKITAAIGPRIDAVEVKAVSNLASTSTAAAGMPAAPMFSSVDPVFVAGNPTCEAQFPGSRELKVEPPADGTYSDGYLTVILAGVDVSGGTLGSWSSNHEVFGIIMKGGPNANFYNYLPDGAIGDTNLVTPTNPSNGNPYGISHISFCYKYKLSVTKTANTTFTRTYQWTIDKSVTPDTWNLFTGDSGTSQYTITVTKTGFTDSNWAVNGNITINNPAPESATISSVSDVISPSINASVNCGVTFPYTLAAGGTLNCSYSSALPDGTSRTNTATANVSSSSFIGTSSGTANVVFGSPTTEVNASINVDDTNGSSYQFNDSGSTSYTKTFTCDDDKGTHNNTATILETGQSDSASVTVNCYALTVTKDASTSSKRTYHWTIDKSADQSSLTLSIGQSFLVNYTVTVDLDKTGYPPNGYVDSDFAVNGNIAVNNPAPIAATINSVSDVISPNINATVDCGSATFPYTLAAGGTLSCTYSANLPNGDTRTNTATATQQNYSYDESLNPTPSGTTNHSGSASVDFSNATVEEVDECIDVDDTLQGVLGTVCVNDAPKTFTYSRTIGPYEACGTYTVQNTASFTTNDTGTTGSDNWTVNVNVPCAGCSLTIGYWKTHAGFGPQADAVTPLLPQLLGTAGGAKSINVTTAAQAVQFLEFKGSDGVFGASNGINKLYAQLLGAKLNIENGADGSAVASTIALADAFLANNNSLNWSGLSRAQKNQVLSWATTLDNYNNGLIGPGHCSE